MLKRILCFSLTALMLLGMMPMFTSAADDGYYHGEVKQKTVWNQQSDGGKYSHHRIPGMVVSQKGTVLVYCEARQSSVKGTQGKSGDWSLMDLYVQRSEDGGETFEAPIYICRGSLDSYATINNPVMIVGQDNTLHLLFCKDYSLSGGGLWYTQSTDDGKTWSEPRKLENYGGSAFRHDCFAFGPTHGICTSDGTLMAPAWFVPKGAGRDGITSHGPSKAVIVYSKDNGNTWKVTDDYILENGNEKCIAELSDGSILLNGRASPNRHVAVATTPLGAWSYTGYDDTLNDPGCCGGIAVADVEGLPRALIYGGCASTSARENVTLYCSFDDGWTWQDKTVALSGFGVGGYVEVYVDNRDGKIYCLYEVNGGKEVRLATVSFYDEFCAGATFPLKGQEIIFNEKSKLSAVDDSKTRNIEYGFTGSALRLSTKASSASKKTQLDMNYISSNVDMDIYKYALIRMRVDESSTANAELSAYFLGWYGAGPSASDEVSVTQTVPNDGKWYNVVLDLSPLKLSGMLHAIEIRLAGENDDRNAAVTLDIESMAFCKTLEEAQSYVFGKTEEEPKTEAPETDTEAPETEAEVVEDSKKKGCGSMLGGMSAFLTVAATACAVTTRKKRKSSQ